MNVNLLEKLNKNSLKRWVYRLKIQKITSHFYAKQKNVKKISISRKKSFFSMDFFVVNWYNCRVCMWRNVT